MTMITEEKKQKLISRPPVVVVLGHIDHGKTSLLMAIKDFGVLSKESGGITQHVGAYQIIISPKGREKDGPSTGLGQAKKITFIDTPGHEAFSAIRARGAKVADIAILVVDSCEGVKPQTKEAISHAKLAGIPIIVALNKIDKPEANPEKIKRELSQENILVESLGGKVPSCETSAKTGSGIEELLELILLLAEMEDFKADIQKNAQGVVIESYLDSRRGPTTTLLLREGILSRGDIVGTSSTLGKVKGLEDFQGKMIKEAFPSDPVIVIGFENVPLAGEKFKVFESLENAQEYLKSKEKKTKFEREVIEISDKKVLNLILKTDVLGSLEAIRSILKNLPQEKVILRVIKGEIGNVSESDIKLAKDAKGAIIAFRVETNKIAELLAQKEKIKIFNFQIIYELSQKIRELMQKCLKPERIRTDLGKMETLVIFRTEKNRQIVGGKVIEGRIEKGTFLEIFRGEEKIGKGKIINLQIDKKNVELAKKGSECGILYQGEDRIQEGDILLIYREEFRKEEL